MHDYVTKMYIFFLFHCFIHVTNSKKKSEIRCKFHSLTTLALSWYLQEDHKTEEKESEEKSGEEAAEETTSEEVPAGGDSGTQADKPPEEKTFITEVSVATNKSRVTIMSPKREDTRQGELKLEQLNIPLSTGENYLIELLTNICRWKLSALFVNIVLAKILNCMFVDIARII